MNIFILILFIIEIILILRTFIYPIFFKSKSNNAPMVGEINQTIVDSEMAVVTNVIDKCIIKTLYEFIGKDHKFGKGSSVPNISWGNYKALIDALIKTNVYLDDDNKVSFFNAFSTKVYLTYVSETSDYIKSLFFKYCSGKDLNNQKNYEPSFLPFIIEYTRMYIWNLTSEIIDYDHKISNSSTTSDKTHIDIDDYNKLSADFNESMYKRLCFQYTHLYDFNRTISDVSEKKNDKK